MRVGPHSSNVVQEIVKFVSELNYSISRTAEKSKSSRLLLNHEALVLCAALSPLQFLSRTPPRIHHDDHHHRPSSLFSAWLTPKSAPFVRIHLLHRAPFAPPLRHPSSSSCIPRAATGDIIQDAGAAAALIAGAYGLVFIFDFLTQRNLIPQVQISVFWIKLVHIYVHFDLVKELN